MHGGDSRSVPHPVDGNVTLQSSVRDCGCRDVTVGEHVLVVGTCQVCLPGGSITWLIENGRQLSLFEKGPLEPVPVPGVVRYEGG